MFDTSFSLSDTLPLQLTRISKQFGEYKVLDDINLTVLPGTIMGLVGVNGVGKTTLIKIILQLITSWDGQVDIFGQSSRRPESRRNLYYLPEKFYPSNYLKGKEFLKFACSYHAVPFDRDIANEYAAALDLDPKVLDVRVSHYSKGMGQKLGLLSMFLVNVPLLILDEPMSGLDPSARLHLKKLLMHYKMRGGTIFFSSHILADIEELSDQMAILHAGKLVYNGTPAEFLSQNAESQLEPAFLKVICPMSDLEV